jgi:hypothetical protein
VSPAPTSWDPLAADVAERAVLGGILLGGTVPRAVAAVLEPQMFHRDQHQRLYAAMRSLAGRDAAVDPVTLSAELNGNLERVGGLEYIATLLDEVPSAGHLPDHAAIVHAQALRRRLVEVLQAVTTAAEDPAVSPEELARRATSAEESLRAFRERGGRASNFDPPLLTDFAAKVPAQPAWVVPGYAARGAVTVIGGHPKVGKTTFVAGAAGAVSAGNHFVGKPTGSGAVLWIDLEQPRELTSRRLTEACPAEPPVYVQWGTLASFDAIKAFCDAKEIVLVVIDSLAKLFEHAGVEDENDAAQVGRALAPLLDFARAANVAVWVIGHLRKSGGTEGLDIRGSVAITAAVDIVVSFRRFAPAGGDDDRRRVLEAYSRYEETPHKLVIERVDGRYRPCGTVAETRRRTERENALSGLTTEPQTAEEVAVAAKMTPSAARTVLKLLASKPDEIRIVMRTGAGKKGDPYRYAKCLRAEEGSVGAEAFWHREGRPQEGADA